MPSKKRKGEPRDPTEDALARIDQSKKATDEMTEKIRQRREEMQRDLKEIKDSGDRKRRQ
jgi:hypothetical protein